MRTLDLAFSTEQNWANVQSILGRPGHAERVVWLETPRAAAGRWASYANALLLANGCQETWTLALSPEAEEDPASLQAWLVSQDGPATEEADLHLHLNGGTKLHQAVLAEVFGSRATLHYTQEGRHHSRRPGGSWETVDSALRPTFESLLYCYGYEPQPARVQVLDFAALEAPFLQRQRQQTPQASEAQLQSRWFAFRKTGLWAQRASGAGGRIHDLAAWMESQDAQQAHLAYRRELRPDFPEYRHRQDWERFHREMRWALAQTSNPRADSGASTVTRGRAFEDEVGHALAEVRPHFPVVAETHNLHIHPLGMPLRRAEVDHAWLLPGGRVWVFECKSGVAERKDMEARIRALRACFGSSAQIFLVVPARGKHQQLGEALHLPVLAMDEPLADQLQALNPRDWRPKRLNPDGRPPFEAGRTEPFWEPTGGTETQDSG